MRILTTKLEQLNIQKCQMKEKHLVKSYYIARKIFRRITDALLLPLIYRKLHRF